jgi:hypothetical protein
MACGPGTFHNSIANQCEIACDQSDPEGRRMANEVPIADPADDAHILAAVSSHLEKHPEDEEFRLRLKQLFGQPALA